MPYEKNFSDWFIFKGDLLKQSHRDGRIRRSQNWSWTFSGVCMDCYIVENSLQETQKNRSDRLYSGLLQVVSVLFGLNSVMFL